MREGCGSMIQLLRQNTDAQQKNEAFPTFCPTLQLYYVEIVCYALRTKTVAIRNTQRA